MEDNMETVKDAVDGVTNVITSDAEVGDENLYYSEETPVRNQDSLHSDSGTTGMNESSQCETAETEKRETLLLDQNSATVAELPQGKEFEHSGVKDLQLPKGGSSLPKHDLIESSVNPELNANKNELQQITHKAIDKNLDLMTQSESLEASEKSLETQAEDEMEQDLNVVTGREPFQGENMTEFLPENEMKNKSSNSKGTGMELTLGNETANEELNARVIEMELVPDIEPEKEQLHDKVTEPSFPLNNEVKEEMNDVVRDIEVPAENEMKEESTKHELDEGDAANVKTSNKSFLMEPNATGYDEMGTEEEQAAFMKELETFHKERCLEFKPPRFYGEPLNCLKLWRAVIKLGGYEQVTSCKLWRQVGESFKPPKTCTTVSWTFRCFYEKALLEYEKHKMRSGELPFTDASLAEPMITGNQPGVHQASVSGRARRDAAARAMQGWHSQRLLGNGEVGDPIIKDKNSTSTPKREKQLKNIGLLKRKKPSSVDRAVKAARLKASKPQTDTMVVDIGPPADWVKINVQRTKDCFEVYALVPGLLREEVRVQSDPAGRLVISGQPEQLDNPWGVTSFKKVVSLPSRIDPHQTSAVVTLHGQLFVRVPFEQSDL
ncbi:hypothetical protein NMG60_11015911 [Bertholletia excelsa]